MQRPLGKNMLISKNYKIAKNKFRKRIGLLLYITRPDICYAAKYNSISAGSGTSSNTKFGHKP